MGDLAHCHTQRLLCRFEKGRNRSVAAVKQMNCATHRRGSDHLLPLDPDEYRWPPQRFQTQGAKISLERQNSKVRDHHFTRAHLQFELGDPLHTGLARYKLVKPAEDRRQAAWRSHVRKIITDRTCNLPKLDRRVRIVRAYGKDDRQGAIVASAQNRPVIGETIVAARPTVRYYQNTDPCRFRSGSANRPWSRCCCARESRWLPLRLR